MLPFISQKMYGTGMTEALIVMIVFVLFLTQVCAISVLEKAHLVAIDTNRFDITFLSDNTSPTPIN